MRSVTVLILLEFFSPAHAKELANQTDDGKASLNKKVGTFVDHDFIDNLVDKLFGRTFSMLPLNADLDKMTLGKPYHLPISPRAGLRSLLTQTQASRPANAGRLFAGRRDTSRTSRPIMRPSAVHKQDVSTDVGTLHTRRGVIGLGAVTTLLGAGTQSVHAKTGKMDLETRTQLLNNERIRQRNNAPADFPTFVRKGFDVTVITDDDYVREENGLIYKVYEAGDANRTSPVDSNEVTFDYVGFNENGGKIDSSYEKNQPAVAQIGITGSTLIPGLSMAMKEMKPGEKRRIVVPPELGPPTGPGTFFSAKQWEVFDIKLRDVKTCERQSFFGVSKLVCER